MKKYFAKSCGVIFFRGALLNMAGLQLNFHISEPKKTREVAKLKIIDFFIKKNLFPRLRYASTFAKPVFFRRKRRRRRGEVKWKNCRHSSEKFFNGGGGENVPYGKSQLPPPPPPFETRK